MADATEIAVEQKYFDHTWECREQSREALIAAAAIFGMSAVKRTTSWSMKPKTSRRCSFARSSAEAPPDP